MLCWSWAFHLVLLLLQTQLYDLFNQRHRYHCLFSSKSHQSNCSSQVFSELSFPEVHHWVPLLPLMQSDSLFTKALVFIYCWTHNSLSQTRQMKCFKNRVRSECITDSLCSFSLQPISWRQWKNDVWWTHTISKPLPPDKSKTQIKVFPWSTLPKATAPWYLNPLSVHSVNKWLIRLSCFDCSFTLTTQINVS